MKWPAQDPAASWEKAGTGKWVRHWASCFTMSPVFLHEQVWTLPVIGHPQEQPVKSSPSSRLGGRMPRDRDAVSLWCLLHLPHLEPPSLPCCASTLTIKLLPYVSFLENPLPDWRVMWSPQLKGTPSSGLRVFFYRTLSPEVFICQRDRVMLHTHAHAEREKERERALPLNILSVQPF